MAWLGRILEGAFGWLLEFWFKECSEFGNFGTKQAEFWGQARPAGTVGRHTSVH